MIGTKSKILNLIICLSLLVGCGTQELEKTNTNLVNENRLHKEKIDIMNSNLKVLKNENIEYKNELVTLEKQIEEQNDQLKEMQIKLEESLSNIEDQHQENINLQDQLESLMRKDEKVITMEDLKEKTNLDGYDIVKLDVGTTGLRMSLEGYFVVEGTFSISLLTGALEFQGDERYYKNQVFETQLAFPYSDFIKDLDYFYEVRYEKALMKEELGEDLYNKLETAREVGDESFSMTGTALFKDYTIAQKYQGGGITSVELVKMLEISE